MPRSRARPLIVLLTVATCAYSALATPVEKRDYFPGNPADLPCTIRVVFESSATGPDYTAWDEIRTYIAHSRDIQRAEAFGWRKEGEFILCLKVEEPDAITNVFSDLAALTPKTPNGASGPTTASLGATPSPQPRP